MLRSFGSVRPFVLALTLAFSLTTPVTRQGFSQTARVLSLQDALAGGQVVATFRGTGSSRGDAVTVDVTRGRAAGSGPLSLSVAPGSVLRNASGGAQNMVIAGVRGRDVGRGMFRPATRIDVPATGVATYILSTFCAEFDKDNPSSSNTFALERAHPTLACITSAGQGLSVPALQAAVWMATDHLTFSKMSAKFSVTPAEWAAGEAVFRRCSGR
jgi:hypothetical protein